MSNLLDQINNTADLRALTAEQLPQLASEIRDFMLNTLAANGGHVASNLGVVELTIALHRALNLPQDKIVWDVGHQCYTHKILSGRKERFASLRQFGGISGFPKPTESDFDSFATGHSSTSVSVAMGLAMARDLNQEQHHVAAVIGDGALTGGMVYEALNHIGDRQTKLMVILNDNEMSIADNVGAISRYLIKLRTHPRYFGAKRKADALLEKLPGIGPGLQKMIERSKDAIKYLFMSQMLFEELGFVYLGPIDGHDLPLVEKMIERAKHIDKPVLIHVLTRKGRGYLPAEHDPCFFHGTAPFDLASGRIKKSSKLDSYSKVFSNSLVELAATNSKIAAITAAMPDGVGLQAFAQAYPQRFFDVGIAEQHALTFAAGLAKGGLRPVVALYSTFLQRAYDQLIHDICLPNLPVVLAIDRAGLVGEDGATHQGIFDLSFLQPIPNLQILAPANAADLQAMLAYAFEQQGPVAIRYPRGYPPQDLPTTIPFAPQKADLLRQGKDLLLLAAGSTVNLANQAADILAAQGIEAAVINARFIKPFDHDLFLEQALNCGKVLILEENVKLGGFGQACLELFSNQPLLTDILAFPDCFIEHGSQAILLEQHGYLPSQIAARVKTNWFGEKDGS